MKITHQASLVAVILVAGLISSPWSVADDLSVANRTLSERTESVIFADPLKAEDLNSFFGLPLRDVPLPEILRDWCARADLTFTIAHGAVLIATERKQTPK